jgi:DNA-binding transcriptional LysR family regulator
MNFRQLKYFIAVAEELHFARAAARVSISQSPLSQQMKLLEEHLGVTLFKRDRRNVSLTPAGSEYLKHARTIVRSCEFAAHAAQQAALGEVGLIRLGYSVSALYSDVVLNAMMEFRRLYPRVDIHFSEPSTRGSIRALMSGDIDAAFVRGPLPATVEKWPTDQVQLLHTDPLLVAIPKKHKLAELSQVTVADLRGEPLLAISKRLRTALNERLSEIFLDAHYEPHIVMETQEFSSLLGMVRAGVGVAIVPEAVAEHSSRYVVYRPFNAKKAYIELYLLLPKEPMPSILNLCNILKNQIECAP